MDYNKIMQEDSKIIVGLDVGTSAVKAVVGQVKDNEITIIGVGQSVTSGMRKGVVTDINNLSQSIDQALAQAEKSSGEEIHFVTVNIGGMSVMSTKTDSMIAVAGQEITAEEVERLKELATAGVSSNRSILSVIPYEFILDGQAGIKDPIGMSGTRLEVKVNVVSTLSPHLDGIRKAVEMANSEINQTVVSSIAASKAVLTEKQKENGVMLLDLGAATTGIAIFVDGELQYTTSLSIGSNTITNDLALKLQINPDVAEEVKTNLASAIFSDHNRLTSIKFDKQTYEFHQSDIDETVRARLNDMFKLINHKLKESGYAGKLPSGVVLTGGGARLKGIENYAKNALGLVTKVANPQYQFKGLTDKISGVEYITAVGLLLYDYSANLQNSTVNTRAQDGILKGLKRFFKR
ncbi:MAG: cell division protein FtsA [Candidatus Saccharibacteria bacterium]|nr:cell division protein FtsA [Candidatus Saccharibacteria bacterium]